MSPPQDVGSAAAAVFVDASGRRSRRLRWVGRAVGLAVLAYLVVLGASFARAPWAPHVDLPGIGSLTPPNGVIPPPRLGARAATTPAPSIPTSPASSAGSGSGAGGGPSPPPTAPGQPTPTTGTTAAPVTTGSTTTTFVPPGQSRRPSTTTTTTSAVTSTTGHGRPSTTTTTNPHRSGSNGRP